MEQTKRVIALGFFDGVHIGHGALLRRVGEIAARDGYIPAALTFDHHPKDFIPGAEHIPLINTPADREELMHRLYGIRQVMVLPLTSTPGRCPGGTLSPGCWWSGIRPPTWWRATTTTLATRARATRSGCGRCAASWALDATSSAGWELDGVTRVLHLYPHPHPERRHGAGRPLPGPPPHPVWPVVHGKGLGRTIGIPTSNLVVPQGVLMPAFGVYATRVWIEGKGYLAVTNVGVRPTVEDTDRVTVEPWILDFDGDLYGQNIRVEFYQQLRPERKFGSIDELKAAILENARQTREYFGQDRGLTPLDPVQGLRP